MKHSSVPMNAFTEHGIIMLAAVLKSKTAITASVQITNTFVAMRKMLASMAPLSFHRQAGKAETRGTHIGGENRRRMRQGTDLGHPEDGERNHPRLLAGHRRERQKGTCRSADDCRGRAARCNLHSLVLKFKHKSKESK